MNGWESTQSSLRSLLTAASSPRGPPSSCQSPRRFDLQFPQTCQIWFRIVGSDYFIIKLIWYCSHSLVDKVLLCFVSDGFNSNPPQTQIHPQIYQHFLPFIQLEIIAWPAGWSPNLATWRLFLRRHCVEPPRGHKLDCDPSCYAWWDFMVLYHVSILETTCKMISDFLARNSHDIYLVYT